MTEVTLLGLSANELASIRRWCIANIPNSDYWHNWHIERGGDATFTFKYEHDALIFRLVGSELVA